MLGNFIYSAEVSDAAVRYAAPRKFEKAVRRFLTLAVIFVTGGVIWIFCISPCMVPVKAEVKSFPGFGRADVLNIAGIDGGAVYISVNAGEVERRLAEYYLVESAKVVKRFPDRLSIFLEPRRAVAVVFARINGRVKPVYFDRYGVAIGMGSGAGDIPAWLPVVSGVLDDNRPVKPGSKISAAYLSLFTRIGAISDEDPKIWQAISEIGIAKKDNDLYDLILYPVHDPIKLKMRSDISKDSIYYALLMFDVCRQFGDAMPSEIDVQSGIGIVNAVEASYGK
ncbi:MAG: FtsQ-type POTRA domain-containing protein [Treponema sp.]|jgi:cell division protein FtsQ|nr:FtsQ-type POTRA domain-containing protein [Treponema sp.]